MSSSATDAILQARTLLTALEDRKASLETRLAEKDVLVAKLRAAGRASSAAEMLPELVLHVFLTLAERFGSPQLLAEAEAAAAAAAAQAPADAPSDAAHRARVNAVGGALDDVMLALFASLGVSEEQGTAELNNAPFYVGDERLPQAFRDRLERAIETYRDAEERLIMIAALGKAVYEQRMRDRDEMLVVRNELAEELSAASPQQGQALTEKIKAEAAEVFSSRLAGITSRQAFDDAVEALSQTDKKKMMRMKVLQALVGGAGAHGHSHDGVPCGGHGHSAPQAQPHGHSHGGEPCGGHGHEASSGHQHAHNGAEWHGHGAGEDEEEEFEEEDCGSDMEEDYAHGHDHSHGVHSHASTHGHSHS